MAQPSKETTPTQVPGLTSGVTAVSVSASGSHTCAIHNGALKCWGYNSYGRLGDGTTEQRTTPTQTDLTSGVTAVSAGGSHTCAIHNGALKCWGRNLNTQLGVIPFTIQRTTPTQVTDLTSGVTAVSAGNNHTCAIHNGALKCWGDNYYGQLGDGTTEQRTTPTQVHIIYAYTCSSGGVPVRGFITVSNSAARVNCAYCSRGYLMTQVTGSRRYSCASASD